MNQTDSLRLVLVLNHIKTANPYAFAMVDLDCTQAARGHEVYVCSGGGGDFEELLLGYGTTHITIEQKRSAGSLLKAMVGMAAAFRPVKPNIVYARDDEHRTRCRSKAAPSGSS